MLVEQKGLNLDVRPPFGRRTEGGWCDLRLPKRTRVNQLSFSECSAGLRRCICKVAWLTSHGLTLRYHEFESKKIWTLIFGISRFESKKRLYDRYA